MADTHLQVWLPQGEFPAHITRKLQQIISDPSLQQRIAQLAKAHGVDSVRFSTLKADAENVSNDALFIGYVRVGNTGTDHSPAFNEAIVRLLSPSGEPEISIVELRAEHENIRLWERLQADQRGSELTFETGSAPALPARPQRSLR